MFYRSQITLSDPFLDIPLEELDYGIDTEGDEIPDLFFEPVSAQARVKALNLGRGKGRQNTEFSDWDNVLQ